MGLLTGFSIITAVEIVYFTTKIIIGFIKKIPRQTIRKISIDSKIVWNISEFLSMHLNKTVIHVVLCIVFNYPSQLSTQDQCTTEHRTWFNMDGNFFTSKVSNKITCFKQGSELFGRPLKVPRRRLKETKFYVQGDY